MYLVVGCVRDLPRGVVPKDYCVATDAPPTAGLPAIDADGYTRGRMLRGGMTIYASLVRS